MRLLLGSFFIGTHEQRTVTKHQGKPAISLKTNTFQLFKEIVHYQFYLRLSSTLIHLCARSSSSEPRLACCHVCSCVSHSHKSFPHRSLDWPEQKWGTSVTKKKQVTHSQGNCQYHCCCANSTSLCWAVKLDIINPILSKRNQLPACHSCQQAWLVPLQVKHETTESCG